MEGNASLMFSSCHPRRGWDGASEGQVSEGLLSEPGMLPDLENSPTQVPTLSLLGQLPGSHGLCGAEDSKAKKPGAKGKLRGALASPQALALRERHSGIPGTEEPRAASAVLVSGTGVR